MPLKTSPIKPKKTKKVSGPSQDRNSDNFVEIKEKIRDEIMKSSGEFSPNEDFDSKREFFRLMAEKIKDDSSDFKESDRMEDKKYSSQSGASLSSYKKMILRFSFLTLILLVVIAYFSAVKLEVSVYANKESIKDSLNFYAYVNEGQINLDRAVPALIQSESITSSHTFSSTGVKELNGEIVGRVTIFNQHNKNQPLVATTRLLSPDNKLFRIKNTVNVPAGGSVEVDIYADEISESMAIEPTRFTIPGLWAGLQDKIYAESSAKFTYQSNGKKFISQSDIDQALAYLNDKMLQDLESRWANNTEGRRGVFNFNLASSTLSLDQELGAEVETFTASAQNTVDIINVKVDDVVKIIKQKLSLLNFSQESSEVEADSLNFFLLSYSPAKSLAEIKVDFSARTVLKEGEETIQAEYLVNLNENQIRAYLDSLSAIKSYELTFKPKFIKRSSILSGRINVVYK